MCLVTGPSLEASALDGRNSDWRVCRNSRSATAVRVVLAEGFVVIRGARLESGSVVARGILQ